MCETHEPCQNAVESLAEGLTGIDGICIGSIMKHLYDWSQKKERRDLEKAKQYIDRLLKEKERTNIE